MRSKATAWSFSWATHCQNCQKLFELHVKAGSAGNAPLAASAYVYLIWLWMQLIPTYRLPVTALLAFTVSYVISCCMHAPAESVAPYTSRPWARTHTSIAQTADSSVTVYRIAQHWKLLIVSSKKPSYLCTVQTVLITFDCGASQKNNLQVRSGLLSQAAPGDSSETQSLNISN